jgi:hypothetical protein
MVDYVQTRAVKEAVEARLLGYPGVHAVAIGPKITGGQRTGEPSILVFLVRKRPLSELAPEEVLPPEIDGVKTDIIEMGVPHVAALDRTPHRPLLGGIAVQPQGWTYWGTLGCFGMTQDTPPKVVAITCEHVVDPPLAGPKSSVKVNLPPRLANGLLPSPCTISFSVQGTTTTGSLVNVQFVDATGGSPLSDAFLNAWWTVTATDTAQTIANNVAAAVNAIPGGVVSATPGQSGSVVINALQPNMQLINCIVFDPRVIDSSAALAASVSVNVITLTGKVDRDYCVYVTWNTNGGDETQGVLTVVQKDTPIATATAAIATSVTNLNIGSITGSSTGTTVTVNNAAEVTCSVTDPRVGQPSGCSNCSTCCSDEMGRVLRADLSVDAALIQVQSKLQYLNEIFAGNNPSGNTLVKGVYNVQDEDVNAPNTFSVHKRGIASNYTSGIVLGLAMNGYIKGDALQSQGTNSIPFHRFYRNAMVISAGSQKFITSGDSGAAVVDDNGNVVAIAFGEAPNLHGQSFGVATPIKQITDRLQVTIATSTALNQPPQTVSTAQGAPRAALAADNEVLKRVLTTQAQLTASPAAKGYIELITRHSREVRDLVNHNRRVTIAWHRKGGPEMGRAAGQFAGQREDRLPQEIDGLPLAERLSRIADALARNGSPELSADLARYGDSLLELASLSYDEALERMHSRELAAADAE